VAQSLDPEATLELSAFIRAHLILKQGESCHSECPDQKASEAVSGFRGPRAEQNPKYPILVLQLRVRLFSLKYGQLLTEGKDLEAEAVAGTEECAEAGEEVDEKWNHEFGFIA
jgi:hypothetical protein